MHSTISKLLLLVFIIGVVCTNAAPFDDLKINALNAWQSYVQGFGKTYATDSERERRKNIFISNYLEIQEHNKNYDGVKVTYLMGVNNFTDLSLEEFVSQYTGAKVPDGVQIDKTSVSETPFRPGASAPRLVTSFDWRTKSNVLTPIKNQQTCGSCWAFGTNAVLEAAYNMKKGSLIDFSEQQLVDCVTGNWGCNGGWPNTALDYVLANGITLEANYPYTNSNGSCKAPSVTLGYNNFSYTSLSKYSDTTLQTVISTIGPVAVPIDLVPLRNYRSGILNAKCSSLNHIVVIVGYYNVGTNPYYIARNSWGTGWGESGYFRISTTMAGNCYVRSQGWYPQYKGV